MIDGLTISQTFIDDWYAEEKKMDNEKMKVMTFNRDRAEWGDEKENRWYLLMIQNYLNDCIAAGQEVSLKDVKELLHIETTPEDAFWVYDKFADMLRLKIQRNPIDPDSISVIVNDFIKKEKA